MTVATLAVSLPRQVRADSSSSLRLDALGKDTSCNGCVAQLLTTASSNDVIVVVVECRFCSSSLTSVADSQGLTYTQRTISSPDGRATFWEYNAVAASPLESDNITAVFSNGSSFQFIQVFAIEGANTSTVFDPNPSLPASTTCFQPGPFYYYKYDCSVTIETSNQDFIIASTSINDDGPCAVSAGYITALDNGNFEVDYRIGGGPNSSIEFACYDTDAESVLVDAVQSATGFQPHPPIIINGNDQFVADNGVTSGTGTSSDPYIIEGWDINASQGNGIMISNTDAYFVLRNVYIHSGNLGGYNGTILSNVANGVVEDNTLYGNDYGVSVVSSYNATIQGNIVQNNHRGAVGLFYSSSVEIASNDLSNNPNVDDQGAGALYAANTANIDVSSNTFLDDGYTAVYFSDSGNFSIYNNNVRQGSQAGISIASSASFSIERNNIDGNNYGNIVVAESGNFSINSNRIFCGVGDRDLPCQNVVSPVGIDISGSTSFEIINNEVYPHGVGLSLVNAGEATVSYNVIYIVSSTGTSSTDTAAIVADSGNISIFANDISGAYRGLVLSSSSNILIYHNTFGYNAIQAVDDQGSNNFWDDGYPAGGNHWSDYTGVDNCSGVNQDACPGPDGIGDTPYVFSGNQDNNPLMASVTQKTLSNDPASTGIYNFPEWKTLSPVWTYQNGTLDGSGLSGSITPMIAVDDTFPSDRTLSVSFRTTVIGYDDWDTAWVVGKYRDMYHEVALTLGPSGILRLEVAYGNAASCGDICANFYDIQTSLSALDWHTAVMRFTGNDVVVSIDGTVFFNIIDANIGAVGDSTILLASWGNSESQFNDLTVDW